MEIIKQVIVVRKDLKMRRGKSCAQSAHASMAFLLEMFDTGRDLSHTQLTWVLTGQTKICVSVDSEQELIDIYQKAKDKGLTVHMITDAGRTEFHGVETKTCLAIGPDTSDRIDPITGKLSLL